MSKIIMGWSKCSIKIGTTGDNDAMAASLTSVGTIKDKSSTLESADGDTLEMKETGGATVGYEVQEGTMTLQTRVIEPGKDFYTLLGIGTANETGSGENAVLNSINVTTHLVNHEVSVKVTPQKIGALGINAPKCTCSAKFGWSEEDGNYVDLTFGIIKTTVDNGYWYQRFVVTNSDLN